MLGSLRVCAIISGLGRDKEKRKLFEKLSAHLTVLANEVERVKGREALRPPQLVASFILALSRTARLPLVAG
jgi:hypothetical protein